MKKSTREIRASEKKEAIERYKLEDQAMEDFFALCKSYLSEEEWNSYYEEMWVNGKWFEAFVKVISCLARDNVPITPPIRKSIDYCLEVFEVKRNQVESLSRLNFDKYWKDFYGY